MVEMTGAKALILALEKEGTDIVFGLPGGANLPIYDALVGANLRHVLVRHEQSAAHMADGYARIKRKAGVCFATSGPGATNLITGIATAYADSSPVVAVTGQVPAKKAPAASRPVSLAASPEPSPAGFAPVSGAGGDR